MSCRASDRLMRQAFGREALGGGAGEVLAELRGQGGRVRLWAAGKGVKGATAMGSRPGG